MYRPIIAFLVAPLAGPILMAAYTYYPRVTEGIWYGTGIELSAIIAYAGAFMIGVPAYLFSRAKKWTAFWTAVVLGVMVAIATSFVCGPVFRLMLGVKPLPLLEDLTVYWQAILWPASPIGAVAGTLLWLIIRPDGRQAAGMYRAAIAFLVAPVAVPILVAAYYYPQTPDSFMYVITTDYSYVVGVLKSIISAYFGVFVMGLPVYLVLRAKKWTAFWIAPTLGLILAVAGWWAARALFVLSVANDPYHAGLRLMDPIALQHLWPVGPIGAVVGALLWAIGRPDQIDRREPAGCPGGQT